MYRQVIHYGSTYISNCIMQKVPYVGGVNSISQELVLGLMSKLGVEYKIIILILMFI